MKKLLLAVFLFVSLFSFAQNRNSNWCFGDSAGMTFGTGSPALFTSGVKSRGSCISMSDSSGQLLFSAYTRATLPGNTTLLKNRNNLLMQNGSNIIGRGWYEELVALPNPGDLNQYYLFSVGVTSIFGLYYSIIDMSLDSGRGAVTLKNIQLENYEAADCLQAIRHGNGRDWWIISRHTDASNNEFYEYLVTPSGVLGPYIQTEGTPIMINSYRMIYSNDGTKLIGITYLGMIEEFSFDRCTGVITYLQTITPGVSAGISPALWSCAFSRNDRYLYISSSGDTTNLHQLDLWDANCWANHDTIWRFYDFSTAGGELKLAPDGKIYFTCAWNDGFNFNYPYPDSVFNMYNNNLSVINYPDSPGVACGFAPFSFNLGQGRTYWGLPNNPDYELGADTNSICDTITAGAEVVSESQQPKLQVFYHPDWQIAFINAEDLSGKNYSLAVYNLTGREVYKEEGALHGQYFTRDLRCEEFANGMYVISFTTERNVLSKKFIKL